MQKMAAEAWAKAKARNAARRADIRRNYQPRGYAADIQHLTNPEIVLSGPAGTGKSRANLEKINRLAWDYPGLRALIVRKTRASLTHSALYTFEAHVLGPGNPIAEGPQRQFRQQYIYPNGSEVVIGGLDKATRIMSTEYDIIFVQEAIELTVDDWESLTTRLRSGILPYQQLIGDTNPAQPTHWLKRRANGGATLMLDTRHEDNPRLWDIEQAVWTAEGEAYIAKLDALTGHRKARLRYGKWVQAEGVVYESYEPSKHLIDRFEIPTEWRRFRVIDFGYTNPFVCQWWAVDGDGRMYLYREIYMSQRLVEDHAVQIRAYSANEHIEATVADHDAEDRATLERHGITTQPAIKEVTSGIQAVQERLKVAGDGKPRLFLMRDALIEADEGLLESIKPTSTAEEIEGYMWEKSQEGKAAKEAPHKVDDHGMDAMRYAVMYLDAGESLEWGVSPVSGYRG